MIDLLFLDTYNVSSAEDIRDWYAFVKDLLVPFTAIVVSIYAVYLGIKRQNKVQIDNKKKEVIEANEMLSDIIVSNNPFLLENIDNAIKSLEDIISHLTLENFSNVTITTISPVHFKIVKDFGYARLFEIIDRKNEKEREAFSKYWVAVDSYGDNYDKIVSYIQKVHGMFYEQNEKLNNLNHMIAIKTSENIHSKIPPYTTIVVRQSELEKDPHLKLAIRSHEISTEFNSSSESMLVKIKKFLSDLFELKNDLEISKIIESEYVQKIERALGILNGMEKLLNSTNNSIENFFPIFDKNRKAIEQFTEMLKAKT